MDESVTSAQRRTIEVRFRRKYIVCLKPRNDWYQWEKVFGKGQKSASAQFISGIDDVSITIGLYCGGN